MDIDDIKFESQIKYKWYVKEDDLKSALEKKESLNSNTEKAFKMPDVEYYLILEEDENDHDEINVLLYLDFNMTKMINASFKISVKSASYEDNTKDKIFEKSAGLGNLLCMRNEIFDPDTKFFVNGYMEIEVEGTLESRGVKRKAPESMSLASVLWHSENDKDVTIIVEEKELKIHKWVLCTKSPVFKAEMESGLKESIENKIVIPDFSFETVKLFVKHCYENNIQNDLENIKKFTDEFVIEILHFADKYDVKDLHMSVQSFLCEEIDEENVVDFANASITYNADNLREFCICFLLKYIGKNTVIDNTIALDIEISNEIGRRCLYYIPE